MIEPILEAASRRAQAADVILKTDETTTLTFEAGRLKSCSSAQEEGVNLRVFSGGRVGFAGSTGRDLSGLIDAAFASARLGESSDLVLPGAPVQPLPSIVTHDARAAAASIEELATLGRLIVDRLSRDACQVNCVVERSVGSVRVANTVGLEAAYDVSSVSLSVELVRVQGDDVLTVSDHLALAELPALVLIEAMVAGILQRLDWAGRRVDTPNGSLPVVFLPSGSEVLTLPLRLALIGKAVLYRVSPLAGKLGSRMFSPSLALSDEPLLSGRPGSRPIDDEGIPCRPLPLIGGGVVRHFVYDLDTAARAGVPPTGHARRNIFGKPQAAYSNLVVAQGDKDLAQLLEPIKDGLLIGELLGVGHGNVIGGPFGHPVAQGYRVSRGEVVGRVTDAAIVGNAYELLGRIGGLGRELKWSGSLAVPPLLIEGVAVVSR